MRISSRIQFEPRALDGGADVKRQFPTSLILLH
jgi:hypothetical protein